MLRLLLKDLWNNLYARYALITFLVLILFASIFQFRIRFYNFWDRFFVGESFDDPLSQKKKPYSFREDPESAQALFLYGLEELLVRAVKLYDIPSYNININKKASLDGSYSAYLDPQSAELIKTLFSDFALFCRPLTGRDDAWHAWQREKQLSKRHKRAPKEGELNPFDYAITEKNHAKTARLMLEVDRNNFFIALRKKPDARAIIEFREDMYRALCRGYETPKFWQRALEYKEYLAEQKVYDRLESARKPYFPDEIARSAWLELAQDKKYHEYLKEFFIRMRSYSGDIDMQLEQAMGMYTTTGDRYYLMQYITLLLDRSRSGGADRARESFEILFAMRDKGLDTNPTYLYALAETSFRMGEPPKARALVNQLLKLLPESEQHTLREVRRLDFILKMSGV